MAPKKHLSPKGKLAGPPLIRRSLDPFTHGCDLKAECSSAAKEKPCGSSFYTEAQTKAADHRRVFIPDIIHLLSDIQTSNISSILTSQSKIFTQGFVHMVMISTGDQNHRTAKNRQKYLSSYSHLPSRCLNTEFGISTYLKLI